MIVTWLLRIFFTALILAAMLAASGIRPSRGQAHQHPTETITDPTAQFYETWMQPNAPSVSCCDKKDCYATPAKMVSGQVLALHRESGDWIEVAAAKVEMNRVSPDGRNHLCASPYKYVYCFVWGGGT